MPSSPPSPALIVAGEASGDAHAARLAACLRERLRVDWFGIGGDQMAAAGVELLTHARELSVLGIVEIVRHLPRIYQIEQRLLAEIDRRRPAFAVLVDLPGINLRLSRRLHRRGIPVVYFVAPQLWAWRPGRVKFLQRYVRKLLCIFPFEEEFFRRAGVEVEYVGHPLVDHVKPTLTREEFLNQHGLRTDCATVCLLPGSRNQEISRHLPPVLVAGAELLRRRPTQFVLVEAPTVDSSLVERLVRQGPALPLTVVRESPYNAMAAADAAIVSSGTATVEGLLLGTPMVVIYRVAPVSWWAGKLLVRTPHYSMVNLIAGRRLAPELIQSDCTPGRIAAEVEALLSDPVGRAGIQREMAEAKRQLGAPGAIERAASAVLTEVGSKLEGEDKR